MELGQEILEREAVRTRPDYRLFLPRETGYRDDNVHLHVVRHTTDGKLFAVWTQSTYDGYGNNHAVFAVSADEGMHWSEPKYIVGCTEDHSGEDVQASWAIPVVSPAGRIYVIYLWETDNDDRAEGGFCGVFRVISTDDLGQTWSEPAVIEAPVTPYDYGRSQRNVIFQIPTHLADGTWLVPFTKWTSMRRQGPVEQRDEQDSRICFFILENIDKSPDVNDLRYSFLPESSMISLPYPRKPSVSVAQEPALVRLPDGRYFCSMRTAAGFVAYSVSSDNGLTWTAPEPVRFRDGTLFLHTLSPAPIYEIGEGKYALLYHGTGDVDANDRNPLYRAVGSFDPDGKQPILFDLSERELFMRLPDEANIPGHDSNQLAMYASACRIGGRTVLWYPDRKCFLLGKYLD